RARLRSCRSASSCSTPAPPPRRPLTTRICSSSTAEDAWFSATAAPVSIQNDWRERSPPSTPSVAPTRVTIARPSALRWIASPAPTAVISHDAHEPLAPVGGPSAPLEGALRPGGDDGLHSGLRGARRADSAAHLEADRTADRARRS